MFILGRLRAFCHVLINGSQSVSQSQIFDAPLQYVDWPSYSPDDIFGDISIFLNTVYRVQLKVSPKVFWQCFPQRLRIFK